MLQRGSGAGNRRDVALYWSDIDLWPGGVVPYVIDGELAPDVAESVRAAIAEWNAKTVISLVPRAAEPDFVRFVPSGGCRAELGRRGGEQKVWSGRDGDGCGPAAMAHEIGHAVGLHHEHQRTDRDERLMVGRRDLHGEGAEWVAVPTWRPRGPYDYRSRMHYALTGMETIPPGIDMPRPGCRRGRRRRGEAVRPAPAATVVATNPPGLEVLVDGVPTTAPAAFRLVSGLRAHARGARRAPGATATAATCSDAGTTGRRARGRSPQRRTGPGSRRTSSCSAASPQSPAA